MRLSFEWIWALHEQKFGVGVALDFLGNYEGSFFPVLLIDFWRVADASTANADTFSRKVREVSLA